MLGGRCRRVEDTVVVEQTLEKHFKRKLDADALFSRSSAYLPRDLLQTANVDTGMPTVGVLAHFCALVECFFI